MSLHTLLTKTANFSVPKDILISDEKGRLEFIDKFPMASLRNLTVEQYAPGTTNDSFCYWLEFRKIPFGIGGGNASKFGLYKAQDGLYYSDTRKGKEALEGEELEKRFTEIKNSIIKSIELTENDEISEIRKQNTPLWNMILQKILVIYFPEKFITIGAQYVLIECARDIGIAGIELEEDNSIQINYEIRKKLSSLPEFEGWDNGKIGSFLWENYYEDSLRSYYIIGSKFGDKNDIDGFPLMLEQSVISTDFASNIPLDGFYLKNHTEITKYLADSGEKPNSYNALKYFLNLKVGDRVAIKADGSPKGSKGFLSIIGIAEVVERDGKVYEYEKNGLAHSINVKYLKAPVYKEFEFGGFGRTIQRVKKPEDVDLIFKTDYEEISLDELRMIPLDAQVIYAYLKRSLSHRQIQKEILKKDAPAQGGGFEAMEILHDYKIEGDKKGILNTVSFDDEYNQANGKYLEALTLLKTHYPEFSRKKDTLPKMEYPLNTIFYGPPGTGKTYNTLLRAAEIIEGKTISDYEEAKRIFNANLGDRIEFITFHQNYSYEDFIQGLRPDTENDKELTFEKKDGIFKNIADRALKNLRDSFDPGKKKKPFDEVFNTVFFPLIEGDVQELEIPMKKSSFFVTGLTNKSIEFRTSISDIIHTLSISTMKKMYAVESVEPLHGSYAYYRPLLQKFLEQGLERSGKEEIILARNYVIIIDEINRANISRVFGELITLIEPDKRSHGAIPLRCTLPSGEEFIVPSNLYIIGTMNTADKSIALLDIALRRRFDFEAMYPKYNIEDHEIYDVDILEKINKRIVDLKGHDFQIGHAYFMGENRDLITRMNKRVIPLLLEYFMNDAKEVKSILNYAGLEIDEYSWPLIINGRRD